MFFNSDDKLKICKNCGYKAHPPYPEKCPKCQSSMIDESSTDSQKSPVTSPQQNLNDRREEFSKSLNQNREKNHHSSSRNSRTKIQDFIPSTNKPNQMRNFAQNILLKARPDMVISGGSSYEVPMKKNIAENMKKRKKKTNLKIKEQKKQKSLDLKTNIIPLEVQGEYFRYFGIITQERDILFTSNEFFDYLLDLASNLEYISTSILTGQLDRMILKSINDDKEEVCYFYTQNSLIYVLYGNIPEKKANWLMRQMDVTYNELVKNKNPTEFSKMERYNLSKTFQIRLKYYLKEYMKLQSVFSSNKLKSVDNFLKVDYFGLSYQSIGILSKLITDRLDFQKMPQFPEDLENREEMIQEMKEGQITAKLEAMAANCVANTQMIPKWISVKLGFQRYRFITFAKVNDYYISLLVEGNLEYRQSLLDTLKQKLNMLTSKPFMGELKEYYDLLPEIISILEAQNNYQPQ